MESHVDYLRAKVLWNQLQKLSISESDVSESISDGLVFASTMPLLGSQDDGENTSMKSLGGLTSNDITRYGQRRSKLGQKAMDALLEILDGTLDEVALYFHAAEAKELDQERLRKMALALDENVKTELTRTQTDFLELSSRLSAVLDLYQEATEVHIRLHTTLHEITKTLPPVMNANHTASQDLLATTIETSLLKLSVVRSRLRTSLYDYSSPSIPGVTISKAVGQLYQKLITRQRALEVQEHEVQSRLNDYQQLLALVDGQRGGFAQVVEDLTTVKRETEECRKDLRRLGWTEG